MIKLNKHHKRRLWLIIFIAIGTSIASGLILSALKQNINVFLSPTEAAHHTTTDTFRLGGLVKKQSVKRNVLTIDFIATDFKTDIPVHYQGILPDLFHEGKGMIAEGKFNSQGIFQATMILAKHDENYIPRKLSS
jgi:cytochrome c-type biogenesis protein CcmE